MIDQAAGAEQQALTHRSPPLITPMLRRAFLHSARQAFDGEVVIAEDGVWIDLEER